MTELGDRFREYAELCDSHPKFVAAGIVARPNETVVACFTETEDRDVETIAIGIYHGVMQPPERPDYFRDEKSVERQFIEDMGG